MFIRICFLFCFFFSFSLYVDGKVGPGNEGGISNESGAEEGVTGFSQCDSTELSEVNEACSQSTSGKVGNTLLQSGMYVGAAAAGIAGEDTLADGIAKTGMGAGVYNMGEALKCGTTVLSFQSTCTQKKEEHEQALEEIKQKKETRVANNETMKNNMPDFHRGTLLRDNRNLTTRIDSLTEKYGDEETIQNKISTFDNHYNVAQKKADYVDQATMQAQSYLNLAGIAHDVSEKLKGNNSGDKKDGPKEPKVLNFSPNTPLGQNQVLGQAHPGRKATPISPFAGGLGAKDPKAEAKGEGNPEQVAQEEKEEMDLNPLSGGSSKKASGLASFAGGHLRSLESSRQLAAQDQKASKSDEETDEESSLDTKPFGSFVGGSNSSRKNSYNSPASKKKYFNKKLAKLTLKKNTKVAQLSGVQKKGVSRNKVKSIFDQMSMTIVSYCSKGHACRGM